MPFVFLLVGAVVGAIAADKKPAETRRVVDALDRSGATAAVLAVAAIGLPGPSGSVLRKLYT